MQKQVWHKIFSAGFYLASSAISAQQIDSRGGKAVIKDTTLNSLLGTKKDTVMPHKVLLIPYEPKMLMSEIGKDINVKTHLSYPAIAAEFRKELDLAMFAAIRRSCVTVTLLDGRQRSDSMLTYIYASTSYSYDIVPGTAPETASTSADKSHYIKNGQLQVPVDYSQRFMNVTILNPSLLADLSSKYNTDTYVFINELDIKNVDNNAENLSEDAYRREVVVHYSILDNTGHYINKGIATTYFPYKENDPKVIGEKYFTVAARLVLQDYVKGLTADKLKEQQKNQKAQSKGILK